MALIPKRTLKAFVRIDGSGRVVAGSLILRQNMPKVGRWQEIPAYVCCNTTTTTAVPTTTSSTTPAPPPPEVTTTTTTVAPSTTTTTTL